MRHSRHQRPLRIGRPPQPVLLAALLACVTPEAYAGVPSCVEAARAAVEPIAVVAGVEWCARVQRLGRGAFDPANVTPGAGGLALRMPGGTWDGAQVFSAGRRVRGSYRALLQTPHAPGSISALFLYEDVPGERNDEIDIEILNDGSRRILLSTWVDGEQTHLDEQVLPFDPAAGPHEYRIDFGPDEVRFFANGKLLRRWTNGLPTRPMRLMASTWWPIWLEGAPSADHRQLSFQPLDS